MAVTEHTKRRTANWSLVALAGLVSLHCSVYDTSLLGNDALTVGGTATMSTSGASGSGPGAGTAGRGGTGGDSEADSGAANAGFGGLEEMAGTVETGGTETGGGSAGKPNTGGAASGGTAGKAGGGAAGKGGGGGTAGKAGGGGTTGNGGTAGSAGAPNQTANGCAKLAVPLDETTDKAHFVITVASPVDLSSATISMRVYVQAGQGGVIFNYVQDSGTYHFLGVATAKRQLLSTTSGWTSISWNVGAEPEGSTGIVKTSIKNIGIEINAQPSSTWSNPTVVYVDSLTVSSPALSFTFDNSSSISTSNNASGALWLNGGSSDTTAANTALSWQATCP